jgi:hypothetical protein
MLTVEHTAGKVIFNLEFARVCIHGQVQSRHGIALRGARGPGAIVRRARVLSADHGQVG